MKHFFSIVTFILIFISAHASSGNTLLFKEGKATIIVEDHLSHPLYWWPTTLLT